MNVGHHRCNVAAFATWGRHGPPGSVRNALRSEGRIKGFKPDAGSFLAYLFAHDTHHRGQISMLARQVGHPLSKSANFGLWAWGTR